MKKFVYTCIIYSYNVGNAYETILIKNSRYFIFKIRIETLHFE